MSNKSELPLHDFPFRQSTNMELDFGGFPDCIRIWTSVCVRLACEPKFVLSYGLIKILNQLPSATKCTKPPHNGNSSTTTTVLVLIFSAVLRLILQFLRTCLTLLKLVALLGSTRGERMWKSDWNGWCIFFSDHNSYVVCFCFFFHFDFFVRCGEFVLSVIIAIII